MMIYSLLRHYMAPLPAGILCALSITVLVILILLGLSQTGVDFRYIAI